MNVTCLLSTRCPLLQNKVEEVRELRTVNEKKQITNLRQMLTDVIMACYLELK